MAVRRARAQKGGNPVWGRGGGAAGEGRSEGLPGSLGAGADRQMVAAGGCGAAGRAGCRSFPPRWAWLLGAQVLRSLARPARTAAERGEGIGGPPGRAWPPASAAALVQVKGSSSRPGERIAHT